MRQTWPSPYGKKRLSYSPAYAEEVVRLFRDDGLAAVDIARAKNTKSYMICLILKRAGLKPSERQRHGRPYTAEKIRAVVACYHQCRNARATGEQFGINPRVVRDLLLRAGVFEPLWQAKPITVDMAKDILVRWGNDESLTGIANALGIAKGRVYQILTEAGVRVEYRRRRGHQHGSWRGGRYLGGRSGYWWIHVPLDDPLRCMAGPSGSTLEHRVVMARHLGRPLTRSETVHHINGDRQDNRIENLQLRRGAHGRGIALRCAHCGSDNVVEVPLANSPSSGKEIS